MRLSAEASAWPAIFSKPTKTPLDSQSWRSEFNIYLNKIEEKTITKMFTYTLNFGENL